MASPNKPNTGGEYSGRWPPPKTIIPEITRTGDRTRPPTRPGVVFSQQRLQRRRARTRESQPGNTLPCDPFEGTFFTPDCVPCKFCQGNPAQGARKGTCTPAWWEVELGDPSNVNGFPPAECFDACRGASLVHYGMCPRIDFADTDSIEIGGTPCQWTYEGFFLPLSPNQPVPSGRCGDIYTMRLSISTPGGGVIRYQLEIVIYDGNSPESSSTVFYQLDEIGPFTNCLEAKTLTHTGTFPSPASCDPVWPDVTIYPRGDPCCPCPTVTCNPCTWTEPIFASVSVPAGSDCGFCERVLRLRQSPFGACNWSGACATSLQQLVVGIRCDRAQTGSDMWRIEIQCDPVGLNQVFVTRIPIIHPCLISGPGQDPVAQTIFVPPAPASEGGEVDGCLGAENDEGATITLYDSTQIWMDSYVDNGICTP